MKRWIVNVTAGASLALAVATATLWARSYFVEQYVVFGQVIDPQVHEWHGDVYLFRGVVLVAGQDVWYVPRYEGDTRPAGMFWAAGSQPLSPPAGHSQTGLLRFDAWWRGRTVSKNRGFDLVQLWRSALTVPLWVPTMAFAAGPAWWWRARSRRRELSDRRASGRCVKCNYDLRGGHERCPECGAARIDQ